MDYYCNQAFKQTQNQKIQWVIFEKIRFEVFSLWKLVPKLINPISHGGGVKKHRTALNPSAVSEGLGLGSPKFLTLFLSIPDRSQRSHFWNFFLKMSENWTSKIFRGPRALGEKSENRKKISFFAINITFLAKSTLYMFSAFFWGIKHFCSSKFEISTVFGLKNLIFDHRHLRACSR